MTTSMLTRPQRKAGADWYAPTPREMEDIIRRMLCLNTDCFRIEYALNAVNQGITALGIKGM